MMFRNLGTLYLIPSLLLLGALQASAAELISLNSVPSSCSEEEVKRHLIFEPQAGADPQFTSLAASFNGRLSFHRGICSFFRSNWDKKTLQSSQGTSTETIKAELTDNELTIGHFRQAQTQGLKENDRATAQLMEGILHCRQAMLYKATNPGKLGTRSFCGAQRQAYASFSRLSLSQLNLRIQPNTYYRLNRGNLVETPAPYTAPAAFSEDTLLGLFASCQSDGGPLDFSNDRNNVDCGQTNPLTPTQEQDVVKETVSKLIERNFGVSGPLTAMFQRKLETVQAPIDQALAAIPSKIDATQTYNQTLTQLSQKFEPQGDAFSRAQAVWTGYNEAAASIGALEESYNLWQAGLLKDIDGVDYGLSLQREVDKVGDYYQNPFADAVRYVDLLKTIAQKVQDLSQADRKSTESFAASCRIFYCAIRVTPQYTEVCKDATFGKNPLCQPATYEYTADTARGKLGDLCSEAGVPDAVIPERNGGRALAPNSPDQLTCLNAIRP